MKKLLLTAAAFCLAQMGFAQLEISVFTCSGKGVATTFARDYQSLGINPANLGWGTGLTGKTGAFTFAEGAYSMYSEALGKPELRGMITSIDDEFTLEEKQMAADNFANTDLSMNFDFTTLGFAFMSEKIGGFAFGVRERAQWYSRFNQDASEIMFMGKHAPYFDQKFDFDGNTLPEDSAQVAALVDSASASIPRFYSDLFDGSTITLQWLREFNFSYGVNIIRSDKLKLGVGAGVKYIVGLGILEVESIDGEYQAYSSLSPGFKIDYGAAAASNPTTVAESGVIPKGVGTGWGFDIGANAIILEKIKVGAAITDIGSVTWDGNVYVANDDTLVSLTSGGFDNYNIFAQANEVVGENGLFKWDGSTKRTVALPTAVRLGGSIVLIEEKLEVGVDMVIPGNKVAGNYDRAMMGVGGEVLPFKWLILSTGFTFGGNYDFNVPVGIAFRAGGGTWEAGVASRDAVTFFRDNRPTLSLAWGFARWRF